MTILNNLSVLELIAMARRWALMNENTFWFLSGYICGRVTDANLSEWVRATMQAGRRWDKPGALLLMDELEKRLRSQ